MALTLPCPHPSRCGGVRNHVVGTAAARACAGPVAGTALGVASAGLAGPPPPGAAPSPASDEAVIEERAQRLLGAHAHEIARARAGVPDLPHDPGARPVDLERAVHAALAASEPGGWDHDPINAVTNANHPSGGHAQVRVEVDERTLRLIWRDNFGQQHREDGPSEVTFDRSGNVVRATWMNHGTLARGDGPADLFTGRTDHAGLPLMVFYGSDGAQRLGSRRFARPTPAERYLERTSAGEEADQALVWLRADAQLGVEATDALIEADADATLLGPALDAGITDVQTLSEVSTGALPLSWAIAGR